MKVVERSKFFMLISLVIIIAGIVVGATSGGLNLGIDFTGGSIITLDMHAEYETEDVEKAFEAVGLPNTPVQKSGAADSDVQSLAEVRAKPMDSAEAEQEMRDMVLEELKKTYPEAELTSVEHVGATASAELLRNAFMSIAIAGVLILIYIAFRFDLFSGFAAVFALIHDVLIMLSIVCIIRMEINSSFIAAVLTIVGYSINNTIVVFDRVRDNQKLYPDRPFGELINRSTRETLNRSLFTSLTTLITIGALYVLGTDSIKDFALPIIIGLLAGTYSSLLLAGPMWNFLRGFRKKGNDGASTPANTGGKKKAKPKRA